MKGYICCNTYGTTPGHRFDQHPDLKIYIDTGN